MSHIEFEPWEPEESVGKLWHALVNKLDAPQDFPEAATSLDEMRGRLGVLFRGLGGGHDVEIRQAARSETTHRLSWRRALGQGKEIVESPSFDGEVLRLPARIAVFPDREVNVALYLWLAAYAVNGLRTVAESDSLRGDIRLLRSSAS